MEDCMEAGAADFKYEEDSIEIFTDPADLRDVREALEGKGYALASAEVEYIPNTMTAIEDPDLIVKMGKMLEVMEDNDDIQNVWHNWDNEEDYEG